MTYIVLALIILGASAVHVHALYPGAVFPWSSGNACPEGYDFCGVLEFCMSDDEKVYGYRLPCEDCGCSYGPGPLIRLNPGNVYKLTLRNAGTEVTNLHTHGLHIVGDGDSDDVTREVSGGGNCLDYTWDIKEDHPGGTYWYHAHHHGLSEKQLGRGGFGMLIVEDNTMLDPALPSWAANERLLQISMYDYAYEMYANRNRNEIIDITAKQWFRLRVSLVVSSAVPNNLIFDDQGMCDIHKVATDGIWRSHVPGPKSSVWELTGASRADFAIRCNTTNAFFPIYYIDDSPVANIWVGPEEPNLFTMTEWWPNRPYSLSDMSGSEQNVPEENKMSLRLGYDYVNDGSWDPHVPLATLAYDQVHEWTLLGTIYHPFHIHLYHMQVVTPGGCGAHEEGEFYDTISAESDCTVRFRTANIGQRCVLHCHVLFHEDNGSMSWVDVVGGDDMPRNTAQSFEYSCPAVSSPSLPDAANQVPFHTSALDFTDFVDSDDNHKGDCLEGGAVDGKLTNDSVCNTRGSQCTVGWTEPGEELTYTFESTTPDKTVNVVLRASSNSADKKFSVEIDSIPGEKRTFRSIGRGWDNFDDYAWRVRLPSGTHNLKVKFVSGNVNVCSVGVINL